MCSNKMQSVIRRKRIRRGKKKRSSPLAAPRVLHVRRKTEGSPLACRANRHRFSRQPCLRPCHSVRAPANTTQFLMGDRFCCSADTLESPKFLEQCSPSDALNRRTPSPTRDPAHIDFIYQSPDEDDDARQTFMEQDFTEVYDTFLCSFNQPDFAEELEAFDGRPSHTLPPRRNDEHDICYYPAPEDQELSVAFMVKDFEDMCEEIYTDNLHVKSTFLLMCNGGEMETKSRSLEQALRRVGLLGECRGEAEVH